MHSLFECWKYLNVILLSIFSYNRRRQNCEGGGFNGSNFQGVREIYGKYFPKGDGPRTKHWKQCTIDLKHKSEDMYVVLKQKLVLLAAEMRLTSLALMVLFFFELANTTISRRTAMMCLWNEVETISNGGHTLL